MARVAKEFIQAHKGIKKEELHNPVIFVVDMINGFIKEGALHDEAILSCVSPIQALLAKLSCRSIFIADSHPPQTREFISYPQHCVIGTSESEVIEELQPFVERLFRKNSTNTFTCQDFQSFLQEELFRYDDIVLTGCCTDICILQFALCLNAWLNEHNQSQKRIIVAMDAVDTYDIPGIHDAIEWNTFAIKNMEANGILVVSHIESEGN